MDTFSLSGCNLIFLNLFEYGQLALSCALSLNPNPTGHFLTFSHLIFDGYFWSMNKKNVAAGGAAIQLCSQLLVSFIIRVIFVVR